MTSSATTIRPMRPGEAVAVAGMVADLARFHGDQGFVANPSTLVHGLGRKRLAEVLVARSGGSLVGFSATYDHANLVTGLKLRHIDLIFVAENARGQGVGKALVAAIAARAQRAGVGRITVRARTSNEGAGRFYARLGFVPRDNLAVQYALLDLGRLLQDVDA